MNYNLTNINAWATGLYVGRAIGACFTKDVKYPEKPLNLFEGEQEEAQKGTDYGDTDAEVLAKQFEQFANNFNKKFQKNKPEDKE